MTAMDERVAVVVNPSKRGWRDALALVRTVAASEGLGEPRVWMTTVADSGAGQAREALAAGARRVVAIGGDGTVRLVAGAVADSRALLGVVPTGTANLFARNVGIRGARAGVALALRAGGRPVDLGLTDVAGRQHPFLVVSGIGQDAATLAETHDTHKRRLGWAAYVHAGLRRLGPAGHRFTMRVDDGPAADVTAWSVLAGNCAAIPLGIHVFPGADPADGRLTTLVVAPTGLPDWARIALGGITHRATRVPALQYGQAQRVEVRAEAPVPVQVDGDVVATAREVSVCIRPGAVLLAG